MAEIIMAIAMLCQTATNSVFTPLAIDKYQLSCQKYYIKCLNVTGTNSVEKKKLLLETCVEVREAN